jgi:ferredoxin
MSGDLGVLGLVWGVACLGLLGGLLRLSRQVAGSGSTLKLGLFLRAFPVPTGLIRRPAVMAAHVVLTWGLVVIGVRLVTLVGRVTSPGYSLFAEWEAVNRAFVAVHEWTAMLMLAAVGFLLLRRWVFKPRHLVLGLSFEVVLFWPALVLFFDLLHESAHVALLVESGLEDHSVIAGAIGHAFVENGFYTTEIISLSRFALWGALAGSAAALALSPFGRNTHWFTGWLGVMQKSIAPVAAGTAQLKALSTKARLDAVNCTECGQCDRICETRLGLEAVRPSLLPTTLRKIIRKAPKEATLDRWLSSVGDDVLARCIGCGDCDDYCPLGIELTEAIVSLRKVAGNPLPMIAGSDSATDTDPAAEKLADE